MTRSPSCIPTHLSLPLSLPPCCLSPTIHACMHDILRVQITPNRSLQSVARLAQQGTDVLQIISRLDTKLPDKVLGSTLQISILFFACLFRPSKVSIRGNGSLPFEALQSGFRFRLRVTVESATAEELIGTDAFLLAKLVACVAFRVVCEEKKRD